MAERNKTSFSRQMRLKTREVHKISDAMVNAKLAFALSDNNVWADGLLVFYEIFKYLEETVPPDLLPVEFHRKEAFEIDLRYYLGPDWKQVPRKVVTKYIDHLKSLNKEQPILLLAYVYHLYMGLLSGGQILMKKRALANRLTLKSNDADTTGIHALYYGGLEMGDLKEKMRSLVDTKSKELNEEIKESIIKEGCRVFELNNELIRSIQGVDKVGIRKIMIFLVFAALMIILYLFY